MFGVWTVVVQQAQVQEYEYRCLLVSPDDPSEYCMGQMKWTSKTDGKFKTAQQKFKVGLAFTMKTVSLMTDANKQYVHSPIQTVVNLADTAMSPVLNSQANACQPEPPATRADCSHLMSHQLFALDEPPMHW